MITINKTYIYDHYDYDDHVLLQTCFFQRAVMRRIATALSLGALASMWRVCSTTGTQS